MSVQWWRSWHGAAMDPKWQAIAARAGTKPGVVSAVAWALMEYASQSQERGSIAGFDVETYAVYSGFPEAEISAIIQSMKDKGVIVDNAFAAWAKRQPQREDYSTPRVTQWREMKRNVTQGNTKICTDTDKDKDKDKDTDKDKDKEIKNINQAAPDESVTKPPPAIPVVLFLKELNAKRVSPAQYRELVALYEKYGEENYTAAAHWAGLQGMAVGRAVLAIKGALPKWGQPKPAGSGPPGKNGKGTVSDRNEAVLNKWLEGK